MRAALVLQQGRSAARAKRARRLKPSVVNVAAVVAAEEAQARKLQREPVHFAATEKRKEDAKLRQAINLYHLSETFFPTKAQYPSPDVQISSDAGAHLEAGAGADLSKGKEREKASFDDTLDSHIRHAMMGVTTPTSSHSNLDISVDFKLPHQALTSKIRDDEVAFGSGSAQPVVDYSASKMERLTKQIFPPPSTSQRQSSSFASKAGDPLPLPPIEDNDAVMRYIADKVRRKSLAARNSSSTTLSGTDITDARGAQVRDALYGTVGIRKPGLEVIRDRIQARDIEKARRDNIGKRAVSRTRAE